MTVHNARARTFQDAGVGTHSGFSALRLVRGDEPCGNADGRGERVHFPERLHLRVILRDDPLAAVAVRDGVLVAERVEELLAAEAEAGLERIMTVVEASMDDLCGGVSCEFGATQRKRWWLRMHRMLIEQTMLYLCVVDLSSWILRELH